MNDEITHFSDGTPVLQTFSFMFPDGLKWEKDMTRDELLEVIRHLIADKDWWRKQAY